MAAFDSASFDTASFDVGSFFMNAAGSVFVPLEFRTFFRTTIKTPEKFFVSGMTDSTGGYTTIKDEFAARVCLK